MYTHSLHRDGSGCINKVEARLNLENTDYKNTQKLTWLADTDHAPLTPTVCVHFEHLINKGVLKPDEDFKDFVNWNSKVGRKYCIVCPLANTAAGISLTVGTVVIFTAGIAKYTAAGLYGNM